MNRGTLFVFGLTTVLLSVAGSAIVSRLRADTPDGNPTPVMFTGLVEGAAAVGNHKVSIGFWKSPDSIDPADELCAEAEQSVTVKADKQLAVPVLKCISILGTTGLWYQLNVDGTKFPRVAVTAVPSAIFAQRAGNVGRTVVLKKLGPDGKPLLDGSGLPVPMTDILPVSYGVCGQTAPTTGRFEDKDAGTLGLEAARTMCQKACGSPTANICQSGALLDELKKAGLAKMSFGFYDSSAIDRLFFDTAPWVRGIEGVSECMKVGPCTYSAADQTCICAGNFNNVPAAAFQQDSPEAVECLPTTCGSEDGCGPGVVDVLSGATAASGPSGSLLLSTCDQVRPIACCN